MILSEVDRFFFANDLFDFIKPMKGNASIHRQSYRMKPKFAISSLMPDMYMRRFEPFI